MIAGRLRGRLVSIFTCHQNYSAKDEAASSTHTRYDATLFTQKPQAIPRQARRLRMLRWLVKGRTHGANLSRQNHFG